MTARVTRDRWHRYAIDQKLATAVTKAVGVMDKPALAPAAAREVAAYAATHASELEERGAEAWVQEVKGSYQKVWNQSRDDGTALHALAESLVYGKELPEADAKGQPWR